MRLERLFEDKWIIDGICGNTGNSYVSIFLNQLDTKYDAHVDGMYAIFERIAERGRIMNDGDSHRIIDKVFQFTQGQLRVLYFYGEERGQVILTHGFKKKGKRTPGSEKTRAKGLKDAYLRDYKGNNIIIIADME